MPVRSLKTDYSNRKKDVSIAYGIDPGEVERQIVNLRFGKVSAFVAGPQKLVQRYMISLLTELTTQVNFPSFGTDLLTKLRNGNLISRLDLIHIYNIANYKVLKEFSTYQTAHPADPDDEKLATAVIKNIIIELGLVSLDIKITTEAGEVIDVLIPLPSQK